MIITIDKLITITTKGKKEKEKEEKIEEKKLDVCNYIYLYFPFMKHYNVDTCFLLAT